jgi:integrase
MSRKRQPKTSRRARGTGTIFPNKRRGGWTARFPGRGEKWSLKHAECVEWLNTATPPTATITLAEWYKRWAPTLDVREQSRKTYEDYFRLRILPTFGPLPVAKITAFDVEEAWKRWGRSVGALTVKFTLGALSACLSAAMRAGIVTQNAVELAPKPRREKVTLEIFSPEELRTILAACLTDPKLYPLAVCAVTGCRIGEALALEVGDYVAGRLTIARTVVVRTRGIGPPKSPNSVRTIDVPPMIAPALSRAPDTRRYRTHLGRWATLLAKLNLRHRGIHALRHSVISYAIADGIPIANVARDAGDSVQTIVQTYCRPVLGKGIADAMKGLYGGAQVAKDSGDNGKTGRNISR